MRQWANSRYLSGEWGAVGEGAQSEGGETVITLKKAVGCCFTQYFE
jgi:hypothetical protein